MARSVKRGGDNLQIWVAERQTNSAVSRRQSYSRLQRNRIAKIGKTCEKPSRAAPFIRYHYYPGSLLLTRDAVSAIYRAPVILSRRIAAPRRREKRERGKGGNNGRHIERGLSGQSMKKLGVWSGGTARCIVLASCVVCPAIAIPVHMRTRV